MRPFLDYLHEIGMAAWLLALYWHDCTPCEQRGWLQVVKGKAIRDSEAAKVLKISVRTAIRWRRRLRESGLIQTEACNRGGFRIWVRRFDEPESDQTHEPEAWPSMQTELVQ